jgi:hypothetical protein
LSHEVKPAVVVGVVVGGGGNDGCVQHGKSDGRS